MDYVLYRQAIVFLKLKKLMQHFLILRITTGFPSSGYLQDMITIGVISFKKNDWNASASTMEHS